MYRLGVRRVLQQLDQLVLVDDLARRGGDVLADLERRHVGHRDREPAFAAFEIVEQVLQAVQQILAAAIDRRAQHLGIGHQEIRRRDRVDELPCIEIDLPRGALVEPFDILDRALQAAGGQQIALLDEVEERVVTPRLVAEAAVFRGRLDDRLGLAAEKALRRALPQRHVVVPQRQLRLDEPRRVRHQLRRHIEERGADRHRVGHPEAAFPVLAG